MFKTQAATPFWEKTWEAGDMLGYVSGFEAFLGTVFLGVVAVRQNERNVDINDRLLKIEETSSYFQRYPNLKVDSLNIKKTNLRRLCESEFTVFWKQVAEEELESNPELDDDQCYLFSFLLKNVSNFNVTIYVESLALEKFFGKKPSIAYDTDAVGSSPKFNVIAPAQSLLLSFVVKDSDLHIVNLCNANMSIVVENNIKEKFRCFLEFLLIISPNDNIFQILSERTTAFTYR